MAQTLTHLLFHLVFSTTQRLPLITESRQKPLYEYMGGMLRSERGTLLAIGGMPDHVHLLVRLRPSQRLSDILRFLKSDSSRWLNEQEPTANFAWQKGYGAFSVSASQVPTVRNYIQNQETHHRDSSFKDEMRTLLQRHQVTYDETYLWD